MRYVLVLTAIDLEARTLARHLGLAAVPGSPWPHFAGGVLEIACVGLRAADLEERVSACHAPSVVIAAGACGALSPALREGDLVVPETVLTSSGERLATDPVPGLRRHGLLLAVDRVLETAQAKARLWMETGAVAADMESGVVLAWAGARGVPAAVVRSVSDASSHGVAADLAGVVEPGGSVSARRALRVVLSRPRAFGQALALRRGTSAALKTVATALAAVARSS